MNLTPWVIGWVTLVVVVTAVWICRRVVANREDDSLHVADGESAIVDQQVVLGKKLAVIDRWGKILTSLAVIYGLALLGFSLYKSWVETTGPSFS